MPKFLSPSVRVETGEGAPEVAGVETVASSDGALGGCDAGCWPAWELRGSTCPCCCPGALSSITSSSTSSSTTTTSTSSVTPWTGMSDGGDVQPYPEPVPESEANVWNPAPHSENSGGTSRVTEGWQQWEPEAPPGWTHFPSAGWRGDYGRGLARMGW